MANNNRGPMKVAAKPKEFKKTAIKMLNFGEKYKKWIIIAVVIAFVSTILTLTGPNLIGNLTDLIYGAVNKETQTVSLIPISKVFKCAGILVCVYLIGATLSYVQHYIMVTVTQHYTMRLRKDISNKINNVPLKYYDNITYGDILSRVTNDVDTVGMNMNHSVSSLVTNICLLVGSLLMMLIKSWILALSVVAITMAGFFVMMIIIKSSQKFFVAQQNYLGDINGHIEESYSGQQIINVYNAKNEIKEKFDTLNSKLYDSAWKSQFMSGLMQPLMSFIGNLGFCVVCVLGVILASKGEMTIGDVSSFIIYIRMFLNPLSQIAQAFTNVQTMVASGERVFEFLDAEEMTNESHKTEKLTNVVGNVEFKNVKFGYTPDKEIIHNFSAKIKAGDKVAIVGKTGAGKTTLVNLLMRFYEIDDGQILIDGVDTSKISRDNVHNLFGMVLQDSWMFEASVRDNIVYNNQNIPQEKVVEACSACGIHNFIKALPNGYDTIIDENTSISAGQKQLLTIARAMVQNNPMLILDEATSSVDTRTEVLIQNAMDKLTENRTSFVIAHRLSTIKNADLILVMENGDIIESGNHKELLEKNGAYASLYNSQFQEV